ncbi:MAG: epoxide hydrolase [Acidimicrobiia bacterium]|nr:epoxide hydrolase [Acidimicrobiia bacterium]
MSDDITPFTIDVPQVDLDDLVDRLRRTRWPEAETVDDWSQGIPLSYTKELCGYWADTYDWRAREAALNRFPQFRTEVDGLGVHFLHVRSPHEDALPLVLSHGWPGSVVEFHKVIEPLTDPTAHGGDAADAFHVVAPSLPGYGFSDKPTEPGWNVQRIADAWAALMARLGYGRYGAQGGDWGAMVTAAIGHRDAEHLAGIHLNMPVVIPTTTEDLSPQEQGALDAMNHYQTWEAGYSTQQSTRPQTIGYGLVDSPAGQAAWIVEKFWAWTDCDGHPENVLTRDELLDNVMLYWLPATGASSARLYWESFRNIDFTEVEVPVGCSIFPKEIFRTSRRWAEGRFKDLRFWSEPEKGGHFAAFEQPERFVQDVRESFRSMR